MENSKRGSIPMQDKLRLSKSQGASTPAELKRMQSVPYASAVGSIMYAVRCTRPDVAFAQNITSRFQQNLVYGDDLKRELRVSCYTDAGYLTDVDDLKFETRYVFVLNGGAVDWKSAKQSIFATSYAEAEYIAAFDASKEAVWVRKFISGLGARHFRAKVHYLREVIEFGDIKLEKVHTYDNLADPFTKALAFPKHSELTRNIGMLSASSLMLVSKTYGISPPSVDVFRIVFSVDGDVRFLLRMVGVGRGPSSPLLTDLAIYVRVDGRSYLLSGATNSSEANGIIRNPKLELESFCFTFDLVPFSCGKRLVHGDDVAKIVFRMRNGHVQVYGYAFWVNQCTSGFHGVNEPGGVRVAREDDRGDTEGREDVHEVFQQRGSYLDVEGIKWSRWMKLFSEYGFKAKYHLGKENVVVESWSRKKSEAKNEFWIDV
ncbi:hypothetical protein Tco_1437783 [Tanacetum coccineum]